MLLNSISVIRHNQERNMSLTSIALIIFIIACLLPWFAPTGKKSTTVNTKALTIFQAICFSFFFVLYFLFVSYIASGIDSHAKAVASHIWYIIAAILLLFGAFTGIKRINKLYVDSANRWLRCSSLIFFCIAFFIFSFSYT